MKISKCKSKRIPARKRYKIVKKVREHHRKIRRDMRKHPEKYKAKRDPGIPNSFPLKQVMMQEAEETKLKLEEERRAFKALPKKERARLLKESEYLDEEVQPPSFEMPEVITTVNPKAVASIQRSALADLAHDAHKRAAEYELKNEISKLASEKDPKKNSDIRTAALEITLRTFCKEFKRVIELSDVILEVLDARDPLATRSKEVEHAVAQSGPNKRLILVLNKIDLVPRPIIEKWLHYLRNEYPTVAFKSSTQNQSENLSQAKVRLGKRSRAMPAAANVFKPEGFTTSRCLGADGLIQLLANYSRFKGGNSGKERGQITVGLVGFPNTGKSSLINSLKRARVCTVGATPGLTKVVQQIHLDKHIRLLDSPGVVIDPQCDATSAMLRNCLRVESVVDPTPYVEAILERVGYEKMQLHYNLASFTDSVEFLSLLAHKIGRLKKHGVPDIVASGRKVLHDWNMGKIRYYAVPPEQHPSILMPAQLVSSGPPAPNTSSTEFGMTQVYEKDQYTLRELESMAPQSATDTALQSGTFGAMHALLDASHVSAAARSDLFNLESVSVTEAVLEAQRRTTTANAAKARGTCLSSDEENEEDGDDMWEDVDDEDEPMPMAALMRLDRKPAASKSKAAGAPSAKRARANSRNSQAQGSKALDSQADAEMDLELDEGEDEDLRPAYKQRARGNQRVKTGARKSGTDGLSSAERALLGNRMEGRSVKQLVKRLRKKRRRDDKTATSLAEHLSRVLE